VNDLDPSANFFNDVQNAVLDFVGKSGAVTAGPSGDAETDAIVKKAQADLETAKKEYVARLAKENAGLPLVEEIIFGYVALQIAAVTWFWPAIAVYAVARLTFLGIHFLGSSRGEPATLKARLLSGKFLVENLSVPIALSVAHLAIVGFATGFDFQHVSQLSIFLISVGNFALHGAVNSAVPSLNKVLADRGIAIVLRKGTVIPEESLSGWTERDLNALLERPETRSREKLTALVREFNQGDLKLGVEAPSAEASHPPVLSEAQAAKSIARVLRLERPSREMRETRLFAWASLLLLSFKTRSFSGFAGSLANLIGSQDKNAPYASWANNESEADRLVNQVLTEGSRTRLVIGTDNAALANAPRYKDLAESGRLHFVVRKAALQPNLVTFLADAEISLGLRDQRGTKLNVLLFADVGTPEGFLDLNAADWNYVRSSYALYLVNSILRAVELTFAPLSELAHYRQVLIQA
jgi:hypothetical protein